MAAEEDGEAFGEAFGERTGRSIVQRYRRLDLQFLKGAIMPLDDKTLAHVAATLAAAMIEKDHDMFQPQDKARSVIRKDAVKLFGDLFEELRIAEGNRSPREILGKARDDLKD